MKIVTLKENEKGAEYCALKENEKGAEYCALKENEKEMCLKEFPSSYQPTYSDTNNTNAVAPAILPPTIPLLFLLEPSSMTLTQKM